MAREAAPCVPWVLWVWHVIPCLTLDWLQQFNPSLAVITLPQSGSNTSVTIYQLWVEYRQLWPYVPLLASERLRVGHGAILPPIAMACHITQYGP